MILVLSDIHGNYDALLAILQEAHQFYDIQQYAILGDSYTLGPNPVEVFDTLHKLQNAVFILGNHEDYLLDRVHEKSYPQLGNFTSGMSLYDKLKSSLRRTSEALGTERIGKIADFYQAECIRQVGGIQHYFCHGRPETNKVGFNATEAISRLEGFRKDCLWAGHIHRQFSCDVGDKKFINPGGSGMPFDGDHRAPYAVIDKDGIAHLYRARYDYLSVVKKLSACKEDLFASILQEHLRHALLVKAEGGGGSHGDSTSINTNMNTIL